MFAFLTQNLHHFMRIFVIRCITDSGTCLLCVVVYNAPGDADSAQAMAALAAVIKYLEVRLVVITFYSSICHWNKLPTEIKQCQVKNSFRKKVTTLIYSRLMADELSS